MAGEDYKVERDGVEMNISKAIRFDKAKAGMNKLNKLKDRFDIDIIENKNNIVKFSLYGNIYYYGLVKSKIRREGEKEWSGKLISILNGDIQKMYDDNDY